jgi:hypothetical protein
MVFESLLMIWDSTVPQSTKGNNGPGGMKTKQTSELANPHEMSAKDPGDEKDI